MLIIRTCSPSACLLGAIVVAAASLSSEHGAWAGPLRGTAEVAAVQRSSGLAWLDEAAPVGAVRVKANPRSDPTPLAPGSRVPAASEILVGAAPVRIELANGAWVELGAGTRAVIAGFIDVAMGRDGAHRGLRIDLRAGEIFVDAPASMPRRQTVLVGSKDLLVAVRAGSSVRARAIARPAGGGVPGLAVAAYSGEARATTKGAWKVVPAGFWAELADGEPMSEPRRQKDAPSWASELASTGASLRLVTAADETAPFSLRWASVAGASGYLVEVARDEGFADVVLRRDVGADETSLETPPLAAGRYWARLRSRGDLGLPGAPSHTRALRVARLVLPAWGQPTNGAWVVPLGRTVRFDDPTGLEVALGRRAFYPATPGGFGLGNEIPFVARVRLAGERVSVPLRLEPRTLEAEVDLSPKTAEWPRDPVDIVVRLRDARRPVPSFEPALRVRIGLEDVAVTWRHEGNTWRARLDPRPPPGPWVVRVEALDPEGDELGRGFLEVIETPQDKLRDARADARR